MQCLFLKTKEKKMLALVVAMIEVHSLTKEMEAWWDDGGRESDNTYPSNSI